MLDIKWTDFQPHRSQENKRVLFEKELCKEIYCREMDISRDQLQTPHEPPGIEYLPYKGIAYQSKFLDNILNKNSFWANLKKSFKKEKLKKIKGLKTIYVYSNYSPTNDIKKKKLIEDDLKTIKIKLVWCAGEQLLDKANKYSDLVSLHFGKGLNDRTLTIPIVELEDQYNQEEFINNSEIDVKLAELDNSLKLGNQSQSDIRNLITIVSGDPGVGKTRLVYHYCKQYHNIKDYIGYISFNDSIDAERFNKLRLKESGSLGGVLVIDNFNYNDIKYIEQMEKSHKYLKIIAIVNIELNQVFENDKYKIIHLRPSEELFNQYLDQISLKYQKISQYDRGKLIQYCSGSFAIRTLSKLRKEFFERNKDLSTILNSVDEFFDVFLTGIKEEQKDKCKSFLKYISIFRMVDLENFNLGDQVKPDLEIIYDIIAKETGLKLDDCGDVYKILKKHAVIQEQKGAFYVSPTILKVYYFKKWLSDKSKFNLNDFYNTIKSHNLRSLLLDEFAKNVKELGMLIDDQIYNLLKEYIDSNQDQAANTLIKTLFTNEDFSFWKSFLRNACLAYPDLILNFTVKVLDTLDDNQLIDILGERRRLLVNNLAYTIRFKRLFEESFDLLHKLSLNENEKYGNNATGVLTDTFSILWGYSHGNENEITFYDRWKYLKGKLEHKSDEVLVKCLCNILDNTNGFSYSPLQIYNYKFDPVDSEGNIGQRGEILIEVLDFIKVNYINLENFLNEIINAVGQFIKHNYRDLIFLEALSLIKFFLESNYNNKNSLLEPLEWILRYSKLSQNDDFYIQTEKLHGEIEQSLELLDDYDELLNTFIIERYGYYGIHIDDEQGKAKHKKKFQNVIEKLAKRIKEDSKFLNNEKIGKIFNTTQGDAYDLGYIIAQNDEKTLQRIVKCSTKQNVINPSLIIGVFKYLFESNKEVALNILKNYKSADSLWLYIELICINNLDENKSQMLVNTLKEIKSYDVGVLFRLYMGSKIQWMPANIFIKLLEYLISINTNAKAIDISIQLINCYFANYLENGGQGYVSHKLDGFESIIAKILLAYSISGDKKDNSAWFFVKACELLNVLDKKSDIALIGKNCLLNINTFNVRVDDFGAFMVKYIISDYERSLEYLLDSLTRFSYFDVFKFKELFLQIGGLDSPLDRDKAQREYFMDFYNKNKIKEWINARNELKDPNSVYNLFSIVPVNAVTLQNPNSLAVFLLNNSFDDCKSSFIAQLFTGTFVGSVSEINEQRKSIYQKINNNSPNVKKFIRLFITELEDSINDEKKGKIFGTGTNPLWL